MLYGQEALGLVPQSLLCVLYPHRVKCVSAHHFLAADDIDAVGQGVEVFRGSGSAAVEMVDGHSLAVGHNGRDATLYIFFYDFVTSPRIICFIQFLCSLGHVDDFEGIAVPPKDALPCTARFRGRHTANVEIGQLHAIVEATASQIRYGGGKRDGDQIGATLEAVVCQSFNGVRYLGLHTTGKEGVGSSFYDGIASLARIVEDVTLFYRHTVYGFTPLEASQSNTLYGAGYADGFQFFTVFEDTPFDSLQGVGEDNGRQGFATIEAGTCYHLQGVRKGDGGQTGTVHVSIIS